MGTAPKSGRAEINGIAIEITEEGEGRPILFLHPGHPSGRLDPKAKVLSLLAEFGRVIAPTHPGFGHAPAPRDLTTVDDLAYLYLDLMEKLGLEDTLLIGVSLGGWIAAEMAVKSTARMSTLVLANAVGIKPGARDHRDIADIYAITDKQLAELVYAEPQRMAINTKALPESELTLMARSRESTGRYAWTPYMHDPKLLSRLHRIDIPTLVLWGAADRVTTPEYGRAYARAIGGARFITLAGAGHFPHLEQPSAFAEAIHGFTHEGAL